MSDQSLPPTFVPGFHDEAKVRQMKYNYLGNTGLKVSLLAFGGGCCSDFYDNLCEEEAIKTIHEALKSGINYIDTAPYYGQGRSETIIGKALKDVPRRAYYIATKVGRYNREYETMFDFSKEKTRDSVSTSLKLLGLDYVDIIQIHDVEFAQGLSQVLNETLPALAEMRDENKVRQIGVTGYPISVLKEAIVKAPIPFNTVLAYARNTLIDGELKKYMPFLETEGLGVICAADHGMGLLTNKGPQTWHPADKSLKEVCKKASDYCKDKEVELGKLALWYSIQQLGNLTHLVGMNTRQILQANLDTVFNGLTATEADVLKTLDKMYFNNLRDANWEGTEVSQYWKYMNGK